jgi:hypothetical protein
MDIESICYTATTICNIKLKTMMLGSLVEINTVE